VTLIRILFRIILIAVILKSKEGKVVKFKPLCFGVTMDIFSLIFLGISINAMENSKESQAILQVQKKQIFSVDFAFCFHFYKDLEYIISIGKQEKI